MDRKDGIYGENLPEVDLTALAQLCANVALNRSATQVQADTAHALRVEWVKLGLDHATDGKAEALRKRMLEFLAAIPAWMMSGV